MDIKKIITGLWILLSVVIMIIIFTFSHQDGDKSSKISNSVATVVASTTSTSASVNRINLNVRKCAHVALFALLGLSVMGWSRSWWKSMIFCYAYAAFDELHQLFINGRGAKITDTFIDAIGFVSAIVLWCLVAWVINRCKNIKKGV